MPRPVDHVLDRDGIELIVSEARSVLTLVGHAGKIARDRGLTDLDEHIQAVGAKAVEVIKAAQEWLSKLKATA